MVFCFASLPIVLGSTQEKPGISWLWLQTKPTVGRWRHRPAFNGLGTWLASHKREGRREAAASTCPGSAHLALLLSINWLKLRSKIEEIRFGRIMVLRSALTDWKVRKKQFKWERNWESNREKCVRVCALEKMCKSVRNRESMCVWEIERVWESRLMKLGAKMSWVTFLAKMRVLRNIVKQWMSV